MALTSTILVGSFLRGSPARVDQLSRREAVVYNGNLDIHYDLRTRHGGYESLDVYLPLAPARWAAFRGTGR